jgi:UDP-GlcNAc3NAcA epimerase
MKVNSIIGARPQFVKAAVVSRALHPQSQEVLVHTGQHYNDNMSAIFSQELGLLEPDINLRDSSGTHAEQSAAMMVGIKKIPLREQLDWAVIYGVQGLDVPVCLGQALYEEAALSECVWMYRQVGLRDRTGRA